MASQRLQRIAALNLPQAVLHPVVVPDGGYARLISLLSPIPLSLDACRWIEAWMRLAHPTLNGLSQSEARAEIEIALQCIAEAGVDESESLAVSFGL